MCNYGEERSVVCTSEEKMILKVLLKMVAIAAGHTLPRI